MYQLDGSESENAPHWRDFEVQSLDVTCLILAKSECVVFITDEILTVTPMLAGFSPTIRP